MAETSILVAPDIVPTTRQTQPPTYKSKKETIAESEQALQFTTIKVA